MLMSRFFAESGAIKCNLALLALFTLGVMAGCPTNEPGLIDTRRGTQEPTSSGGADNGGVPAEEPEGTAPTVPQAERISNGVHAATLQAAEAKRFRLPMAVGESAIVSATVHDDATDVDLFVYSPHGSTPITSAGNAAGLSDFVQFIASQSGDYSLEIVNISRSRQADCTLNLQRIDVDSTARNALNGTYTMVEADGQPLPATTSESWVFSDRQLVSYFGTRVQRSRPTMSGPRTAGSESDGRSDLLQRCDGDDEAENPFRH